MPCPCENNTEIGVNPIELDIIHLEKYTTFQGNLFDFSLYVKEENVIRIEKIQEGEYLIVWCESVN